MRLSFLSCSCCASPCREVLPRRPPPHALRPAPIRSRCSVGSSSPPRTRSGPAAVPRDRATGSSASTTSSAPRSTPRRARSGARSGSRTPTTRPIRSAIVWLQLDQNLFNSDSRGFRRVRPGPPVRHQRRGGLPSRLLKVAQPAVAAARGKPAVPAPPLTYLVNGTMMRVDLARPLPPKGKQLLELAWSLPVRRQQQPDGRRGPSTALPIYEVAQWYPRLAVYDDVRGWNTEQYHGPGRVLSGVRQLRRQPHRARRHARGGHRHAPESRRGADRGTAGAAGAGPDQQRDRRHPRQGRDRRSGARARPRSLPDAHLAVHGRQRPGLRLGGRPALRLGRGRRERRRDRSP